MVRRHGLLRTWAAVFLGGVMTACAPAPVDGPPPTGAAAVRSLRHELPAVLLPDGQRVELELAVTPDEISQGLMFRPALASDRGMLFLFDHERQPSFWMKNTLIPLDLVFLDSEGLVVDVIADARPCAADPCPQYQSSAPARAVLEINAGHALKHGIAVGSRLSFERVPGYPRGAGLVTSPAPGS